MIAFIKRRWILLTCALVLMVCSLFDFLLGAHGLVATYSKSVVLRELSLADGEFRYHHKCDLADVWAQHGIVRTDFHPTKPRFGDYPDIQFRAGVVEVLIPLWLPLSAILGWIVIRELRWRERKAKLSETRSA